MKKGGSRDLFHVGVKGQILIKTTLLQCYYRLRRYHRLSISFNNLCLNDIVITQTMEDLKQNQYMFLTNNDHLI